MVNNGHDEHHAGQAGSGSLMVAGLAALGIVYGDIGTSPLYAFKVATETVAGSGSIGTDPVPVLGVLSLIIWSLLIVVALKYVVFVMRADNHGEGGILALLALGRRLSAMAGSGCWSRSGFSARPCSMPTGRLRPRCRC